MDAYEASGSNSFDGYFLRQLRATGMNMSQIGIFSAREKESVAPVTGRPPSILGLGTLALGMFITFSL